MTIDLVLAAAIAAAGFGAQASQPAELPLASPSTAVPQLVLPKGTMVRLMVTKEVNSRDNKPGDRFALRVDEDVQVGGAILIPTGAKAWGELVGSKQTGGVGKSGKINARLLYVETNGKRIDLDGQRESSGSGGTGQVIASVIAFGPFGLLMKGNNATLKAGEILNGYTLADIEFSAPASTQ